MIDPAVTGFGAIANDVTVGAYDVVMSLGPSYATKRAEARDSMIEFGCTMPQQAQIFADLIAKAQDWPGADEIAKRLRRTIPQQILEDPQAQPSPEMLERQAKAQAEGEKMQTEQQSKLFELEAQRRKLLLDVEWYRARVLAEGQRRSAEGRDIGEQLKAIGQLDGIVAENSERISDL